MNILLTIHSVVRWAVTLVAIALIVRLVLGLVQKRAFDQSARGLLAAFSGLMDAQMLLGLLLLLIDGFGRLGFPRYRLEHAGMMLVAVIIAHLPAAWKKLPDQARTRNTLIAVIAALIFIAIGISPIGGWVRWWNISY